MEIFADYHTHTQYSHGQGSVEDNIRAGLARGLAAVAISDHGPAGLGIGVQEPDTLLRIKAEVDACQSRYPGIRALTGVEANVISLDGALDVPKRVLAQLDVALAGLHLQIIAASLADEAGLVLDNWLGRFSRRQAVKARISNTKAIVGAVYKYDLTAITHPGLNLSIDTGELARACAKRGTALEINAGHARVTPDFVRVGMKAGAKFVFGSDAHSPARVGDFARAEWVAAAADRPAEEIINARPTPAGGE